MPMQSLVSIETTGPGLYEFTDRAAGFVRETGAESGLLTLFEYRERPHRREIVLHLAT